MIKSYTKNNFIKNSFLILLFITLSTINFTLAAPGDIDSDGDGLIDISSIEQLNNMRHNLLGNSYKSSSTSTGITTGCPTTAITRIGGTSATGCYGYELTKSLDFNSASSYSSGSVNTAYTTGNGWTPIGSHSASPFTAVFSGNGYSIYNLYIYNTANIATGIGLFAHTSSTSIIQDLSLVNSSISTVLSSFVGGLIGRGGGTIRNIAIVGGSISASSQVGSLIGRLDLGGAVFNIAIIGTRLTATNGDLGGIAGFSNTNNISNSYSLPKELRATTLASAGEILGRTNLSANSAVSNSFYINNFQNLYNPTTAITPLSFSNNVSIGGPTSTTGGVSLNDMIGIGSNNLSSSNLGTGFSYSQNNLPKVNLYNTNTPLEIFNDNLISNFVNKVATNSFGAVVIPTFNGNTVTFSPNNYTYYTDSTLLNLDNSVTNSQYTFASTTKIKTFYFRDVFNDSGSYKIVYNPNTNPISNVNIDPKITDGLLTLEELNTGFTISGKKDIYNPLRVSLRQNGVVKGYKDINFTNTGYVSVLDRFNTGAGGTAQTDYLLNYVYFNPDNTAIKRCLYIRYSNVSSSIISYSFKGLTATSSALEECPVSWVGTQWGQTINLVSAPQSLPSDIAFAYNNRNTGFGTNPELFSASFNNSDMSNLNVGAFDIFIEVPNASTSMYIYSSSSSYTSSNYNYGPSSVSPIITTQPTTTTPILNTESSAIIQVVASTTAGTLSYQWQSSTDNINFTNVTNGIGATSSSYTTPIQSTSTILYYRVVITNTEVGKLGNSTTSASLSITSSILVTGISLSTSSLSLLAGATSSITATIYPANALNRNINWTSSNPSVATVATVGTTTGLITAVSAGTSTITATTADGSFTATTSVIITNPAIPVTAVSVNPTSLSLITGATSTITATISPANALNRNINWTSSNPSVIELSNDYVSTILGTTGYFPASIITDSSGNIYTANNNSHNVSKITPDGVSTILATTGGGPYSITMDSAGNLYTANLASNDVSKITPDGVSTILGTTGTNPDSIVIDNQGNIYTANYASNNVSKITPDGISTILATTGEGPFAITIDSQGNLYTANYDSYNVSKITPAGVSTILGTTGIRPSSITIDSQGNIYTANYDSNNVTKITPAGATSTFGTTGTAPAAITIDSQGNVYTANYDSNNVSKITPDGISTILATVGSSPNSITMDSAGNLYTANLNSDNVSKIRKITEAVNVKALSPGTSTITATTLDGSSISATSIVTVSNPAPVVVLVTGLSLSPTTTSLLTGATTSINTTITPNNASNPNLTWSSSNDSVATVNATSGLVTAVASGTATITATTADGTSISATSIVTVSDPAPVVVLVTGLSLSPTTTSLLTGATTSINTTITPNNASNPNLTWSSSNDSVATVNATSGLVTAVASGTATITATTADGSSISATSIVIVNNPAPASSSISGSIYHYSTSSKIIQGAQISLTNTDNNTIISTTTTNNTGAYTFNNIQTGGNYKISVSYTTSSSTNGININDNIRNAQIIVGTFTPTDDQKISGDTNQDGIININDNIRNAQIIVGTFQLANPFIFISTDKTDYFATNTDNIHKNYTLSAYQSKSITNLQSNQVINFKGYKVGDSNGDWR